MTADPGMTAAEALQPPPPDIDPQAEFAKLRAWTVQHCADSNPIRSASVGMAYSAYAHRLLKYGPDDSFNALSARELLLLCLYLNGPLAEYILRVAYFRALIEGDHDIYEYFNTTLFIPECRAWYWTIVEAMLGKHPSPDEVTVWLEAMHGEEKSTARLIIARVFPDTAHSDWLGDLPDTDHPAHGRLAAEICLILASNPLYTSIVKTYLRTHPQARYSIPEQRWGGL